MLIVTSFRPQPQVAVLLHGYLPGGRVVVGGGVDTVVVDRVLVVNDELITDSIHDV